MKKKKKKKKYHTPRLGATFVRPPFHIDVQLSGSFSAIRVPLLNQLIVLGSQVRVNKSNALKVDPSVNYFPGCLASHHTGKFMVWLSQSA